MLATTPKKPVLNPREIVGNKLKTAREQNDLSQRQLLVLANSVLLTLGAIGLPDKSTISRLESGIRELKYLEALAIARVLKVDPEHFWF